MLGDGLLSRLRDRRRSFQGVRHLHQCLSALEQLGGAQRPAELALWYHNLVTSGTRGRHEEAAAAVAATELLGAGFAWAEVGQVARLVLVTADHLPRAELPESRLVSDADLSGLAAPFELVDAGFQDRREELFELDDQERIDGQRQWVHQMLARDRIFHTDTGAQLWEERARENLAALLTQSALA
jgi:Uncharacterized protein conserved in bacteria